MNCLVYKNNKFTRDSCWKISQCNFEDIKTVTGNLEGS